MFDFRTLMGITKTYNGLQQPRYSFWIKSHKGEFVITVNESTKAATVNKCIIWEMPLSARVSYIIVPDNVIKLAYDKGGYTFDGSEEKNYREVQQRYAAQGIKA